MALLWTLSDVAVISHPGVPPLAFPRDGRSCPNRSRMRLAPLTSSSLTDAYPTCPSVSDKGGEDMPTHYNQRDAVDESVSRRFLCDALDTSSRPLRHHEIDFVFWLHQHNCLLEP